jgi:hypothetical protein
MAYLRSISTAKQSVRFVQSDMKYKYCTSMNLDSLLRYLISAREGETNVWWWRSIVCSFVRSVVLRARVANVAVYL